MIDAYTWIREHPELSDLPWLVFGKGPSFAHRSSYDSSSYHTLGLNHVVRETKLTAVHIIDLEVAQELAEAIDHKAKFLVMPFYPHSRGFETKESLPHLVRSIPLLAKFAQEGRLVYYNLQPSRRSPEPLAPVAITRSFSVVAAINLLGEVGVQRLRTLGIDGGRSYSPEFRDLAPATLLANGRSSFDDQFEEIPSLIRRYDLDLAPLDKPSPLRIFVGASCREWLAAKVLEYSLRSHATRTISVVPMYETPFAETLTTSDPTGTPFSYFRFAVPQLCGRQGRAIYLDSDMLVFRDLSAVWDLPFGGAAVLAAGHRAASLDPARFAVLLLDCEALPWDSAQIRSDVQAGTVDYQDVLFGLATGKTYRIDYRVPAEWNSIERFDRRSTALLHYSHVPMQPWLSSANPLAYLWVNTLMDAVDEGAITLDEVGREIELGHARPSLLYQMEQRLSNPLALPKRVALRDRQYVPPYVQGFGGKVRNMRRWKVRMMWYFQRTPIYVPLARLNRHRTSRTYLYVVRAVVNQARLTLRRRLKRISSPSTDRRH